jgi:hypothetical protein
MDLESGHPSSPWTLEIPFRNLQFWQVFILCDAESDLSEGNFQFFGGFHTLTLFSEKNFANFFTLDIKID